MDYKKQGHSPQRKWRIADLLGPEPPVLKTPLSERPRDGQPQDTSFVDKLQLHKESPKTDDGKSPPLQDVSFLMEDTDAIIKYGLKNSKQQQQIQNELKSLLEHEQKIIEQIFDRANKFKDFKDVFKKNADEFEEEHNNRIPFYAKFLKQLAELPETQHVTQEGMPKAVQAKILYNIVEGTTDVANNTIVQLSMEKTLMNDIDLSMQKLRNFADFMKTNFETWSKNISTQEKNLEQILNCYNKLNEDATNLKHAKPDDTISMKPDEVVDVMKTIEERLSALEDQIKAISNQGVRCGERDPTTGSSLPPQCQRILAQRKQYTSPCGPSQRSPTSPECSPLRRPPSRVENRARPIPPSHDDANNQFYQSPQEDRLYAGQDKFHPQQSSVTPASSSQTADSSEECPYPQSSYLKVTVSGREVEREESVPLLSKDIHHI